MATSGTYLSATYFNYSDLPNQYITKCSSSSAYSGTVGSYNNERELFDILVTEAYNKHGVCMDYYITTFDTNYDKIFGENNDRSFTRRFKIMAFYQLPREEKMWTKLGIEGLDNFSIFISKRHFWESSKYNYDQTSAAYSPYFPKIGDYLMASYNQYAYEIVEVKDEQMMYLQSKQHVWELLVRTMKDEHIQTTSLTSASPMSAITNQDNDVFNIKDVITSNKDNVNYQAKATEDTSQDPFGSW